MDTKTIAIIGGGFAGTTLARELDGKLPSGYQLMLISEESHTTFNPMLPETLGATIFPEQVVAPIRQMLVRGQFVMGRVQGVDMAGKTLVTDTLAGVITIPFEHLVLAFGNRARMDIIPGLAENALPLKTVGDAMHIRNLVLRRLAQMELESDPALRRRLGHFVVIGGGFSGVETAGELVDCLQSICRYFPRTAAHELQVTILQDQARLLPELPERLGMAAQRSLLARGVIVRTGERAVRASENAIELGSGEALPTSTIICTIGTRPNPLVLRIGIALERGRIVVNDDFSVTRGAGLWSIGDCASVRNAYDGKMAPPTAQFAVREAKCLARNLLATLQGRSTAAFSYRSRGSMAAIGHRKGVAEIYGIPFSGFLAWILWRGYYLSQMPTIGRKMRIFIEWTWGMFFPNDITHLRFQRSHELP